MVRLLVVACWASGSDAVDDLWDEAGHDWTRRRGLKDNEMDRAADGPEPRSNRVEDRLGVDKELKTVCCEGVCENEREARVAAVDLGHLPCL